MADTIFGVLLIVLGAALALWGLNRHKRLQGESAAALSGWPSVEGTLHEARINRQRTYGSEGGADEVFSYTPVVRYSYAAEGRQIEGTRAFLTRASWDAEDAAEKWLAGLTPGGPVTVRHDPLDPSHSALELDAPTAGSLAWILVGAAALLGLGLFALAS